MQFHSNDALYQLQIAFMNKSYGLLGLFDRFEASSCFSIPSNEPVINGDNITFGPEQYTVEISDLMGSNLRIIYYCLLYYTFEKNPNNEGSNVYQRLLEYIKDHDLAITHTKVTIAEEEIKEYYARFFISLFRAKCQRKLVVQELSALPQMDLLMRHFIQSITGQNDLIIQINASEVQKALWKELGFQIQFLSNEVFIFQKRYVVEIRHFSETGSFLIRQQKEENLQRIRNEINIGESAYFFHEINRDLCGNRSSKGFGTRRKFNVIKKSTVKSIGLSSEFSENFEENIDKLTSNFGGILVDCVEEGEEKNLSLQDFSKKIVNSLAEPLQTERKGAEDSLNFKKIQEKDVSINEFQKIINKSLTFQTEPETIPKRTHKKSSQVSDLASSSVRSVNSTKSYRKWTEPLQFYEDKYKLSLKSKKHKDSFASVTNTCTFLSSRSLAFSYSTNLIKSSDLNPEKRSLVKRDRRIPTFIINRQKANQAKNKPQVNLLKGVFKGASMPGEPKITFSYKTTA